MTEWTPDRWRQIERLYHAALDVDVNAREAFLARVCGQDEALRQEVRSLLGYDGAADRFLERPAIVGAARLLAASVRPSLAGRTISDYDVGALIGAGGMGEVYRARDRRLGRDVALKVLEPWIAADPEYRARFEREAQAASALNHPNIVTIYSIGDVEDVTFLTMELVRGRTLRESMGAAMAVASVLDIAVQMAGALVAAHAIGITHRDLKPENVMVTADGLVKVLDFGVAKVRGAPDEEGSTVGTAGYMSPEQVLGHAVGPASDQFAFGAMLYELLAGRHPFQRESKSDTLNAILNVQPRPLGRDVPAPLRRVVSVCLSKQVADRYATTRDLEAAIRDAREAWARHPTRRQLFWIATSAATAVVTGTATWMLWPPPTVAVLPFATAAGNEGIEYLGLGLTESLIARINHLPVAVKSFSLVSNFAGSTADPRAIGRQLGVDHVVTGSVALQEGRLLVTAALLDVATGQRLWQQRYDRLSASIFKLWDELATAIIDDGLHLRLTREERRALLSRPTDNVEAFDLFLQGRRFQMRDTEDDYATAREFLRQAVERDPRFAEAWVALAGTYWTAVLDNYIQPAEAWHQVDVCLRTATELNSRLPDLDFGRATRAFFSDWNWRAAQREWAVALEAPDRDIQPELLLIPAMAAWAFRDVRQALRLVNRARGIDPLSPLLVLHEASYLLHAGDADNAAARCLSVIAAHPDSAAAYFTLAEVRRRQRQFRQAITARRTAHELHGDTDDELDAALAAADGEEGYAEVERVAVRRLELRALVRRARTAYASPLDFARAYAQLADDRAFDYLDEACEAHSPGLVFLNVDRAWDSVRRDPRFIAAVKHVGLPS